MMRRNSVFFAFIFATVSLFGIDTDIVTYYKEHGIKGVEKQLDLELAKTSYWESYLADKDTTFGYIESYDNILACDKSKSKLYVYRKDTNSSTYQLVRKYNAFTGKLKGDKNKEGDLRTPIGIYEITKKLEKVDPFYGPLAFVTSYPNTYDKYRGKTGKGIWIHGLPINQERDKFTKGCIAIDNSSLECLDKHLDIKKTILIIDSQDVQKDVSKNALASLLAQLYKWRYTWRYNQLEEYLSFYAPEFKRFDGMDKTRFSQYKKRVFAKNEPKDILFSNINIIPYPDAENLYKITFHEEYKAPSFVFSGEKTLIVKLDDEGMHIITER